jgi:hypothetical protein
MVVCQYCGNCNPDDTLFCPNCGIRGGEVKSGLLNWGLFLIACGGLSFLVLAGSISLLDKEGKIHLWSSAVGHRSLWWGAMKPGEPHEVADRLVHNLSDASHSDKEAWIPVNNRPSKSLGVRGVSASSPNQPLKPNSGSGTVAAESNSYGDKIELDDRFPGSAMLEVEPGLHRVVGGNSIVKASNTPALTSVPPAASATEDAARQRNEKTEQPALDLSRQTGAVSDEGFANCGESLKEVPVSSSKMGLKSLRCGEKVRILGRTGDWIRIRTKDNAEGFVTDRFIGQTKE